MERTKGMQSERAKQIKEQDLAFGQIADTESILQPRMPALGGQSVVFVMLFTRW